jgi:hypothetical protein
VIIKSRIVSVIVGLPILRLVLVLGKKSANLHVLEDAGGGPPELAEGFP